MKIAKRSTDNVVLFFGEDLVLDEAGLRGAGWTFRSNIDPNDLVLDEAAEIPEGFVGGGWTYVNGVWTINTVGEQSLLPAKRAEKIADLQAIGLALVYSDIAHAGQTWKTDPESRSLLSEILSMGSVPEDMYWRDASGAPHTMTYAELQALARAIFDRGFAADKNMEIKKAAIAAATTSAQIDLIFWGE